MVKVTDYEPYTTSKKAEDVEIGDAIVFGIGGKWYTHSIIGVGGRDDMVVLFTPNDISTFTRKADERLSVVAP